MNSTLQELVRRDPSIEHLLTIATNVIALDQYRYWKREHPLLYPGTSITHLGCVLRSALQTTEVQRRVRAERCRARRLREGEARDRRKALRRKRSKTQPDRKSVSVQVSKRRSA